MYYVYILKSETLDRTYVGHTNDVQRRLLEHNSGNVPATANARPWTLEIYLAFDTRPKAIAFERYLKSHSGRAFMAKRLL
ncbi:MAG: GIY-YIG nuclease family protein [Rhodothermales bacterium]